MSTSINRHAIRTRLISIVQKYRQRSNMIEMSVRNNDVLNPFLIVQRRQQTNAPGINCHTVVY